MPEHYNLKINAEALLVAPTLIFIFLEIVYDEKQSHTFIKE